MQLSVALNSLETAVENQLRIAGPELNEVGAQLMAALKPAIKQAMNDVVAMAVEEISSQLDGQDVEIKLVDGEPELVVTENSSSIPTPPPPPSAGGHDGDDDARITLRLPGYLKELITAEADTAGDSINSYVVDILNRKARRGGNVGTHKRTTIEL